MRLKLIPSLIILSLTFVTLGFQNCSQSSVIDITPARAKVLRTIQPALAVRGIACITCHMSSSSNVVTDYGYGSPHYFDSTGAGGESFYLDYAAAGSGIDGSTLATGSTIVVPKVEVPSSIQSTYGVTSLAEYLVKRVSSYGTVTPSQVQEVYAVKIAIPTLARIKQVFNNPTNGQVYAPSNLTSPSLAGLVYFAQKKVYIVTNLTCDGDLYLDGTVFFENATVSSSSGCRFHVTGSVFIDGTLTSAPYASSDKFYNTQIISAQSIWMGSGLTNQNGALCDVATSWYASEGCANPANFTSSTCDSFKNRSSLILAYNGYSDAYPDVASLTTFMNTTVADQRANIESVIGHTLMDASCEAGARNLSFSRLLLAAPYVSNRYTGDFSGSIIADIGLMSLATFTYSFDPIFSKVDVLPLFDDNEILDITLTAPPTLGVPGSAAPSN